MPQQNFKEQLIVVNGVAGGVACPSVFSPQQAGTPSACKRQQNRIPHASVLLAEVTDAKAGVGAGVGTGVGSAGVGVGASPQ